MPKRETDTQELSKAWEQGIENALTNAPRAEDLDKQQLNIVAGLHIESGLRGGLWGQSENKTECTCPPCY